MKSLLKNNKLKDLTLNITDGEHGTVKNSNNSNYYLLSNKNIKNNEIIINSNDRRISEADIKKIRKRSKLSKHDVVVSSVGTIGKSAIIKNKQINYDFQRSVAIIKTNNKFILPDYLNYFFQLPYVRKKLNFISNRSIQKCLFIEDFENLDIDYVDIKEQKEIINFISIFDEKIRLNNVIISNSYKISKLIYEYWFQQFEFNNENNKPYLTNKGELVYNDILKIKIPSKWEVKNLNQIESEIITGKTPSTKVKDNFNGEVPFISIDDIRNNIYITKYEKYLSKKGAHTQKNKFINKGSICVTCIASPGLVGICSETSQTNQQINSININNKENRYFLYFYLKKYFQYAKAKSGNTFLNMNKDDFSNIKVLKPEKKILTKFNTFVSPFMELIFEKENLKISSKKEYLLPVLMNGQIYLNKKTS